jgi:hypothetical protein
MMYICTHMRSIFSCGKNENIYKSEYIYPESESLIVNITAFESKFQENVILHDKS